MAMAMRGAAWLRRPVVQVGRAGGSLGTVTALCALALVAFIARYARTRLSGGDASAGDMKLAQSPLFQTALIHQAGAWALGRVAPAQRDDRCDLAVGAPCLVSR
jgi:hypothetical protein